VPFSKSALESGKLLISQLDSLFEDLDLAFVFLLEGRLTLSEHYEKRPEEPRDDTCKDHCDDGHYEF